MMTGVAETRGATIFWDKSVGSLMTGRTAAGAGRRHRHETDTVVRQSQKLLANRSGPQILLIRGTNSGTQCRARPNKARTAIAREPPATVIVWL